MKFVVPVNIEPDARRHSAAARQTAEIGNGFSWSRLWAWARAVHPTAKNDEAA